MPIVPTSKGYVIVGPTGAAVAGPFPSLGSAVAAEARSNNDAALRSALRPPPEPAPRRPRPVAIQNEAGTYSITAGDGTGRVRAGPFDTKAAATRVLGDWAVIDAMKQAPAPLRRLVDVGVGHLPYSRMNITPGYRSPDVEDGRDVPPKKK